MWNQTERGIIETEAISEKAGVIGMIYDKKVDLQHTKAELKSLPDVFASYGNQVVAAYLFGSLAAGTETPLSDVDIAFLFEQNLNPDMMQKLESQLYFQLTSKFRTEEIDLVNLNQAPLSICYGVLKNSQRIYYSDKAKTVDFENETVLKYLDFKPYREEMQREFLAGLKLR